MKVLRFYGASDDLFEFEGPGMSDEISAWTETGAYKVTTPDGQGLYVTAQYAPTCIPGACWVLGVAQLDEDAALPAWPIRFEVSDLGYSPLLVIEAPDDVTVVESPRRGDS